MTTRMHKYDNINLDKVIILAFCGNRPVGLGAHLVVDDGRTSIRRAGCIYPNFLWTRYYQRAQ